MDAEVSGRRACFIASTLRDTEDAERLTLRIAARACLNTFSTSGSMVSRGDSRSASHPASRAVSFSLSLLPELSPSNPLSPPPRPRSRADLSGVITDYPHEFRRSLERKNYPLAPPGDAKRVMKCLEKHNQYTADKLDGKGY